MKIVVTMTNNHGDYQISKYAIRTQRVRSDRHDDYVRVIVTNKAPEETESPTFGKPVAGGRLELPVDVAARLGIHLLCAADDSLPDSCAFENTE